MWTLTGFADEISPGLDEQLRTLAAEEMRHLELRAVWGTNVLKLSDDELARVKTTLQRAGVRLSSIAKPIGKIQITDDFAPHLEDFKRALHAERTLDAPYIRIFSFFIPQGEDLARHRGEVLARMGGLVRAAEGSGLTTPH